MEAPLPAAENQSVETSNGVDVKRIPSDFTSNAFNPIMVVPSQSPRAGNLSPVQAPTSMPASESSPFVYGESQVVMKMAMDLQQERARVLETLKARDYAVAQFTALAMALREATERIERLEAELQSRNDAQVSILEGTITGLREELETLKSKYDAANLVYGDNQGCTIIRSVTTSEKPADIIAARNALLAELALPNEAPHDSLSPIVIPSPFTLHDFLANAVGPLKNFLSNYRALVQPTTAWCADREEHGYFLVPVIKYFFYNKDGSWYYAGTYKAFRFPDLTVKEWARLSDEASPAPSCSAMSLLVKETIAGRKNTSPQHFFEARELYAAGALRVACIGLQCVGFNKEMHRLLLDHAATYGRAKYSRPSTAQGRPASAQGRPTSGVASSPPPWNPCAPSPWNPVSTSTPTTPWTTSPVNGVLGDVINSFKNMNIKPGVLENSNAVAT
ncbi:hypothetical protein FISHEDRAFT_60324 [Fistulina hepatica ATCC 64428]|uniref:DUF6697 domain-containing protein n=1 Tax=Fistulina hepatica ATCC 64428 TaxID=1128425 RepID=A0A0D7A7Z2_9AGAR|nr:hypothetical protein FISHEDRAFT_60324 [Fistulina hepatica ATCC 64428]